MTAWRLEWLRLTRSRRAVALGCVYVFFGLLGPVMAKYMEQIVNRVQSGVRVTFPAPTPATGITNYVSQVSQTGLVVVVLIAASAFSFDSRRGLSTFLRTRATIWQLVAPRFVTNAAAAVAAYVAGSLAAWYETALLLGAPPAGPMLAGITCGALYLVFAVAVTAAASSIARSTLGSAGITLAALLLLPVLGTIGALHDWLPSTLVDAPVNLLGTSHLADFVPSILVTCAGTALLLAAAVARLRAREV